MRNAFADEITKLAGRDDRIVLLAGDIGNRLFDPYKDRFAGRFFNCGVAEANMMGVASGLALCGLRPVTYTITPFITARCFEQIKLDVCYHNVSVVIVGVGSGFSYASLGPTHHSWEDIGLLRLLPNMSIVCPGDAWEVRAALRAALVQEGPVYLRLGKKNEPLIHDNVPDFEIGKAIVIRKGAGICLLACGTILPCVLEAADLLEKRGTSCQVVSFHTVKPLDTDFLSGIFNCFELVATVEEHGLIGGMGSSVAEWLADNGPQKARLLRCGTRDEFLHEAGGQDFARRYFGLSPETLAERILEY